MKSFWALRLCQSLLINSSILSVSLAGTGFEGHEFFEAPSIRKHGDTYYFVYSSSQMHELCYATSKYPTKNFSYRGVIVSNCDDNIAHQKPAGLHTYVPGNNHGGMVEILTG